MFSRNASEHFSTQLQEAVSDARLYASAYFRFFSPKMTTPTTVVLLDRLQYMSDGAGPPDKVSR